MAQSLGPRRCQGGIADKFTIAFMHMWFPFSGACRLIQRCLLFEISFFQKLLSQVLYWTLQSTGDILSPDNGRVQLRATWDSFCRLMRSEHMKLPPVGYRLP